MEKSSNAKDTSMNYRPTLFGEDAYDLISNSKGSLQSRHTIKPKPEEKKKNIKPDMNIKTLISKRISQGRSGVKKYSDY